MTDKVGSCTTRDRRAMSDRDYTATEMMIVAAAQQLAGERVCFVGIGPSTSRAVREELAREGIYSR
jgi:acyl CoA:acetate/3-ketoacid CoA transferase beta subunit